MSLESQISEFSDKLTFIVHDLEDIIRTGIMSCEELSQYPLLQKIFKEIKSALTPSEYENISLRLAELKKRIYNYFRISLYRNCIELLEYVQKTRKKQKENDRGIFITEQRLIVCEVKIQKEFEALLQWMYKHVYGEKMKERDQKAKYTMQILFDLLYTHEELRTVFNQFNLNKNPNESLARYVTDLIVMTGESYIRKFFDNVVLA